MKHNLGRKERRRDQKKESGFVSSLSNRSNSVGCLSRGRTINPEAAALAERWREQRIKHLTEKTNRSSKDDRELSRISA